MINPEEKTNILSARLLQLNTEYTKAQADRVKKEAAYNSVKDGTLAAAQVSTQGEALKKLTENLNDAQQKFAEVKNHYGVNHPEYKKAQARVDELQSQIEATRAQHRPARRNRISRSRESRSHARTRRSRRPRPSSTASTRGPSNTRSLKREADGDKKLYEELVRKIKEAGINAEFPEQLHPRRRRRRARDSSRCFRAPG